MDRLYPIKEVLKILSISRTNLYSLMKDGKLKAVKLGGRTLFKESELNRFIKSLNGSVQKKGDPASHKQIELISASKSLAGAGPLPITIDPIEEKDGKNKKKK